MRLKALGGLALEHSSFTRPTPLLLLSYLNLEGAQPRRHLAELFWQEGNRLKSLSMALTLIKQGAGEVIEADKTRVWSALNSDVKDLLESLDKTNWQMASQQYQGAFLEGVSLDDWSSELEEWVYTTREYLAERVQYALLNLAEEAAKKQDFDQAGRLAERAYKLPGLSGNELTTLKRLYPLLCAGNSLLAPVVRKEAESYDLSLSLTSLEARQKFMSLKPEGSSAALPVRNTSFVGRQKELGELIRLLRYPGHLILSLVGAGGTGKTRLALQLAQQPELPELFKNGIFFISLDALKDTHLLPSTLLQHFGLSPQPTQTPLEQLGHFLSERESLLILDNFEHLADAAVILSQLLSQCSQLKILVTSRERLRLEEEHVFLLEGLAYPTILSSDALDSEALQLFKERAQQLQPHFSLAENLAEVIRICQLVGGLPLGIELATTWIRLMSCDEIASEIMVNLEFLSSTSRNIPDRHRSLKAVFDYSWHLLSEREQAVLQKLSIFRGGFRREGATEVAEANIPILASLVDKSLLRVQANGRYDRHPLLYQFTLEKLSAQPDELRQIQTKHADYFLRLAKRAEANLRGFEQLFWFKLLDEERDNIRLALSWLEQQDNKEGFLELTSHLGYFWFIRGYYEEGLSYLLKAHQLLAEHKASARALLYAASITYIQGKPDAAKNLYEQSLTAANSYGDTQTAVLALLGLGRSAFFNGSNPKLGRSYYEQSLALARANQDALGTAISLASLGYLLREQGDYKAAKQHFSESLELDQMLGDQLGVAENMNSLANLQLEQGNRETALELYEQSLEIYRTFNEQRGIVQALANLGIIHKQEGRAKDSLRYHQEALELSRELGDKRAIGDMLNYLASDLIYLEDYQAAKTALEECLGIVSKLGNKWQQGDALRSLAEIHSLLGEPKLAQACYAQCLALAEEIGDKWGLAYCSYDFGYWHLEHESLEKARELLQTALDIGREMQLRELIIKAIEGLAQLAYVLKSFEEAAQLFGTAANLRKTLKVHYHPQRKQQLDLTLRSIKSKLATEFDIHWALGQEKAQTLV